MRKSSFFALATSLVLLAGCAGAEPEPEVPDAITVLGSITVPPVQAVDPQGNRLDREAESIPGGGPCKASRGFDDISEGSQVTVSNASGEIIGVGRLAPGIQQSRSWTYWEWFGMKAPICEFAFSFDVPADENFYVLTLGNANRGELTYTAGELQAGIFLTLGGP